MVYSDERMEFLKQKYVHYAYIFTRNGESLQPYKGTPEIETAYDDCTQLWRGPNKPMGLPYPAHDDLAAEAAYFEACDALTRGPLDSALAYVCFPLT